jgi:hypothetical protein
MPPPPLPSRSVEEMAPQAIPRLDTNRPRPGPRLGYHTSTQDTPGVSDGEDLGPTDDDVAPEYVEDVKRENSGLKNQVEQLKMEMDQTKARLLSETGKEPTEQEVAREWLRQANTSSSAFEVSGKNSVIDKKDFGSNGGKLVHTEKIPTGPNSIRAEELRLTSVFDEWSEVSQFKDSHVRNRPRGEYYAARVPLESDLESDSVGEGNATLPPRRSKQPPNSSVKPLCSGTAQKLKFRPLYEKYPDAI